MTLAPVPALSQAANAEHHVGVLAHRLRGSVDLREVDIVELGHRKRCEAHIRDVHEGVETRARLRDDVAAERREIVGACVARRNAGRGALMGDELIRRNTNRRPVGKDVAMQVDQTRRHQLAAGIEYAQRPARRDVGFDRFDHAVTHADVALAAQRLARIEYVSAFDHEIELVVRRHGGARRAAQGERERTGGDEKIAA